MIYITTVSTHSICQERVKSFTFPSGELNCSIAKESLQSLRSAEKVNIVARITSSEEIIKLLQVKDILDRNFITNVQLTLPYVPFSRQDRVCNEGESLSLAVFCKLINSLEFSKVVIADPHSEVTPALISRVEVITKAQILAPILNKGFYDCLVAPDAGASKEVSKLCIDNGLEFIQGLKHRDLSTGALSGFSFIGDVAGKRILLVDDICDGGGTFIGLAKKLTAGKPPAKMDLYTTHGMFTNGCTELSRCFDVVFTTNSYHADIYKWQAVRCLHKF